MSNNTYSPADVVVSVNNFILSGYMSGTHITASRAEDSFKFMTGNDRETCRTLSANRSGQIVITLLQTSQSNDFLSALQIADEASGKGQFVTLVKDLYGKTLVGGSECWLTKPADIEFGDDGTGREWTIQVAQLNMFVGGSKD